MTADLRSALKYYCETCSHKKTIKCISNYNSTHEEHCKFCDITISSSVECVFEDTGNSYDHRCTQCGYYCEHNFGESSTNSPTCTEAGTEIKTCTKCSYVKKKETTPPIGHKWVNYYENPNEPNEITRSFCPNCNNDCTHENMSGNCNGATCNDCGWGCPYHYPSDPTDVAYGWNCTTCKWNCTHNEGDDIRGYCDHCGWKCEKHKAKGDYNSDYCENCNAYIPNEP